MLEALWSEYRASDVPKTGLARSVSTRGERYSRAVVIPFGGA
jgi:hypothetical protein